MLCEINVVSGECIYIWITLNNRTKIKKGVHVNESNHIRLADGILLIDFAYREQLIF